MSLIIQVDLFATYLQLSIEIREFLARAQSAYTLIRDSSKCSPKMNNLAEQFIVEIMFRYGKLAQQTMVTAVLFTY